MLDFIYDSLETVKSLHFPTKKEMVSLTIAVFVVVIVAGVLFVGMDTVFGGLHQLIHSLIRG